MSEDLSSFFNLIAEEKRKKDNELKSIIGDLNLDGIFEEVSTLNKSKNKSERFIPIEQKKEDSILIEKSLGLLSQPSDQKIQQDPLTPLTQNFATLEDLQKHYKLFLERIQQQLSTLGGGGESSLAFMDMPITYVTSSSYAITPQDYYIGINYAGAVTITLPTPRKNGKVYIVKDELGEASKGTNRYITILPSGLDKIDGRDRAILAYDFGSLTFVYRNGWRVV